jgi:hypothetical protein
MAALGTGLKSNAWLHVGGKQCRILCTINAVGFIREVTITNQVSTSVQYPILHINDPLTDAYF